MCLALPYRVISVSQKEIRLELLGKKRKVKETLVKIKPGDFVLVQNDVIIQKIPKKQAQSILKLIQNGKERRR